MKNIYYHLPITLQHIACSIEGYRINKRRFDKKYYEILQEVENRYSFNNDDMISFRNKRLQMFVKYAADYVPFYRELFRKEKINSEEIKTIEDLNKIPIIEKNIIKSQWHKFLSDKYSNRNYRISKTSGTTGSGFKVANSRDASRESWAIISRFRKWHGILEGTWSAHIGGRQVVHSQQNKPPYWRYNWPGKQILFSGYHMREETIGNYVNEINKQKIQWIHGYPSLISLVARYVIDHGIQFNHKILWVTTGSENLLPHQIHLIKNAFQIHPIQQYGLTELVAHFSECENGMLHVDEDFSAVEFIPVESGEGFKIIGTNLSNLAMPLIRYDTGDIATLGNNCSCGRPGRVVYQVDGREEDYIILKDGTRHGRTASIFKYMHNIKEAQLYQKVPGIVSVRIVPSPRFSKNDERLLIYKFAERFRDQLNIVIDYKTNLERTKNGKLRFVISDVINGKIKNTSLK
jgi:phenylacetate-CoA ligase